MTTGTQECDPAARMGDAVALRNAQHPRAQPNMSAQAERCGSMARAGDNRLEGKSPHLAPALSAAARARALSARIRCETSGLGINNQRRRMPVADRRTTVAPTSTEVDADPSMQPPPPIRDEEAGSAGRFVRTAGARDVPEEDGEAGPWHLNSARFEEPDALWRRMLAWTLERPGVWKRARPSSHTERDHPRGRRARGFGAIDTTAFDQLHAPAGREACAMRLPGNVGEGMSLRQSRALVPVAAALPTEPGTHVWLPRLRYLADRLGMAEARTGFHPRTRGRLLRRLTAWAKKDATAARASGTTIHASFDPWYEPAGGAGVLGWLVPRPEPLPARYTPRPRQARGATGAEARATLSYPFALGVAVVFGAVIGVGLSVSYGHLPERFSNSWLIMGPLSGISAGPAASVQQPASRQQAVGLARSLEPAGDGRTEVQAARAPLAISGPLALEAQFGDAGEHPSADRREIERPVAGEWQVLYRLGHEFRRKGDLDAAVQMFALAAKVNPSHVAILYDWGYGLQQKGEDLAAIEKYGKVVELDPTHPYAHYNLAYLLQQQGQEAAALKNYRAAARTSPDNPFLYYNWGLILKDRGDGQDTVQD
jgi:hypothetical protein